MAYTKIEDGKPIIGNEMAGGSDHFFRFSDLNELHEKHGKEDGIRVVNGKFMQEPCAMLLLTQGKLETGAIYLYNHEGESVGLSFPDQTIAEYDNDKVVFDQWGGMAGGGQSYFHHNDIEKLTEPGAKYEHAAGFRILSGKLDENEDDTAILVFVKENEDGTLHEYRDNEDYVCMSCPKVVDQIGGIEI